MFKNKTLQLKLVNDSKTETPNETSEAHASVDYVQLVRDTTETVAKHVVIGVGVFVAADTLRQVIVKLTPSR